MQLQDNNSAVSNLSALIDFSNNINSNLNLDFALNNLLLTCFGKLLTSKGIIALYNEVSELEIKLLKGYDSKSKELLNTKLSDEKKSIKDFCEKYKIDHAEEITSSSRSLGFLFLGNKINNQEYSVTDKQFISTITKIGSTTIRNAQDFAKLENVNKELNSKINQLKSIFEIGKEFSGTLEIERISKLLGYSISAQMLISKFGILLVHNSEVEVIESKFSSSSVKNLFTAEKIKILTEVKVIDDDSDFCEKCKSLGIELIVPMIINDEVKGIILLGKRFSNNKYSKSDVEYISSIASFAIISIENSKLFDEAIEKQKLEKDLEIARNIQQNLLPQNIPSDEKFDISAINETARMVGGDFYDIVERNKKELLLAIADVSGKGIQASLLMANLQAFLKSIYKQNYKLAEASNFLNDLVSENTTNGSFITFFWGIFNKETYEFTFVNMGHNPPLLVRNGEITKLKKGGMILGVMKTIIPYEFETVKLEKDDLVVCFTDGVTEAMNNASEEYSDERLENLVIKHSEKNSKEILQEILDDVKVHTNGNEQSDDITCIVFKIK